MGNLRTVDKIFCSFRDIYPDMPMQMAHLFLHVAMREGVTQAELSASLGMPQASVSRNVLKLAQRIVKDDATGALQTTGLDLIKNEQDLYEPRRFAVHLTPKGKALRDHLLEIT